MSKKRFISQFFSEKKQIGAISPSSRFLADKMLENITFSKANVIVELGPGTGVFTQKILEQMEPNATLLVFELNNDFFKQLSSSIKDQRVILIHDSAEKLNHYLLKHNISEVDYVVSSLPLSNFPLRFILRLLRAMQGTLSQEGKFIQFQYSLQSKKTIEHVFKSVSISFTPLNIPPAFVYTCSR